MFEEKLCLLISPSFFYFFFFFAPTLVLGSPCSVVLPFNYVKERPTTDDGQEWDSTIRL
jgi:hypothetical protein